MPTKLVAQFEYTDAELLSLYREALAQVSVGKSYTIRGKQLTRADVDEITRMIGWLEQRIDAAAGKSLVVHSQHARR